MVAGGRLRACEVIPAEAGIHGRVPLDRNPALLAAEIKMGSSVRWNDGDVDYPTWSARELRAWIPAFAGMTVTWFAGYGASARFGP